MAMKVPSDRMVDVGGINTRYWVEGAGSPVVLIHGLSNSIEHWLLNINALAAENTVYALDLVGHGRTDKPLTRSYDLSDLARFVIDFMDKLGIERADLVGHSLGGGVALVIAETFPERVRRLVLVDSVGLARDVGIVLRLVSVPGVGEVLTRLVLQGDFPQQLKRQRAAWPDADVVPEEMIRLRYEATRWQDIRATYFKTLRAVSSFRGVRSAVLQPIVRGLRSLHLPVLVVWGEQDDLLSSRHARIVQNEVAGARIEIFEDAGHDPMVVNPERFNRVTMQFLRDTSS
jgi:4,5:9,10-diseco-3-hydroxy-5,9,17-trioxoandrosta-1(10),2-diene-4-oate hydrolase